MTHEPLQLSQTTQAHPLLATVEVLSSSEGYCDLLDEAITCLGRVLAVKRREYFHYRRGVRLTLASGACLRLLVTAQSGVKTEADISRVAISVVVDDPGTLPPELLRAGLSQILGIPFTTDEMAQLRVEMPLTATLPEYLPAECLFRVAPILAVHHMTDFLIMVEAIQRMGVPARAITVLDKGYRYLHSARVDGHLRRADIAVWPWEDAADALADHIQRAGTLGRAGMMIDDGGYLLPVLLDAHPGLADKFCGLVEQTISGIFKIERFGDSIPLPIFSVAESRLKATIESYGIADAAVRNIVSLLPNEKFEGQPALVIGFGRLGEQIADVLDTRRMRVAVYDREMVRLIAAHERGFLTSRSLDKLLARHQPFLIIGSTGRTSLRGEHLRILSRDAYLVSVTSRTHEFALDEFRKEAYAVEHLGTVGHRLLLPTGRTVTVVGDGYPVNFHYAESLPNKYADLVLAALLVGAATLAQENHGFCLGHNVARTDKVLESCGLLERYYSRFGPDGDA
jgi:adenosylhomocysteinase